nr:MAG: RNA-dependent RNA polymerase [Betapartitivirus sp.]
MSFLRIRDYFNERLIHLKRDWKIFQRSEEDPEITLHTHLETDIARLEHGIKSSLTDEQRQQAYEQEYNRIYSALHDKAKQNDFPEEFYRERNIDDLPDNRIPPSGLIPLPFEYHRSQIVTSTEEVPETGFKVDPRILRIIRSRYPQYMKYIHQYVRPLGTTDATIQDFFKPQTPSDPIPTDRKERILKLVIHFLACTPFLPIHFIDSLWDKTPLHTGTGYYNRHSYGARIHAMFSSPRLYERRTTSKGYFINYFLETSRATIHNIKKFGYPFDPSKVPDIGDALRSFILKRPTMLFTRNHISDRDGNLKQRPVYAVDDLFIRLESMVTFPLHVMARKIECCIMYGYETIRGSNRQIDKIAQQFKSFFTIDWSGFDQRLPRVITDIFWTDFLERMIVISHGYQPTFDYPSYPDLTPEKMFQRVDNILYFLHTWFNNLVYVTADGYSYVRTCAGVPSGLLNTQYLDSFGNLFLIFDGLIEFGCSDAEIYQLFLLIMGDDNSAFTLWSIAKLEEFLSFFESYALRRFGMVLSKMKSVITVIRGKIETLSYQCNYGAPRRPLGKLVAQLCYPERGPRPKYTSARAIGMAYAACAMDRTFHDLCRDIYYEFLDDAASADEPFFFEQVQQYLPGILRTDETLAQQISLSSFPSFLTVQQHISRWQGPLSYYPKWDRAHFVNDPDVIPPSAETMADYRARMNIPRRDIPSLWQ